MLKKLIFIFVVLFCTTLIWADVDEFIGISTVDEYLGISTIDEVAGQTVAGGTFCDGSSADFCEDFTTANTNDASGNSNFDSETENAAADVKILDNQLVVYSDSANMAYVQVDNIFEPDDRTIWIAFEFSLSAVQGLDSNAAWNVQSMLRSRVGGGYSAAHFSLQSDGGTPTDIRRVKIYDALGNDQGDLMSPSADLAADTTYKIRIAWNDVVGDGSDTTRLDTWDGDSWNTPIDVSDQQFADSGFDGFQLGLVVQMGWTNATYSITYDNVEVYGSDPLWW